MEVRQSEYGTRKTILFNLDQYVARPIMVDDEGIEADAITGRKIVKAGSILNIAGEIVNDATARYVLLQDIDVTAGPAAGAGVYQGTLDLAKIQSITGVTVGEDAKTALKGIFFMEEGNMDYNAGYGNDDSQALAFKAFTTEHEDTLALTVATVAIANSAAVEEALSDYALLSADIKLMAATQKALLDSLRAQIVILTNTAAYEVFTTAHAVVLALTELTVAASNITAILAALTAYDALSSGVKVLAADNKTLLDALLIAAYADEYATFTTDHANALALTVEEGANQATLGDVTIVEAALTAYELLSDSAKVLAADDKTLLDALLAFIETLD